MFKNKRIVAMVLCALMLFVPVAAMAAPYDFYSDYKTKVTKLDVSKVDDEQKTYGQALSNALNLGIDGDVKATEKGIKDAVAKYERALEDAKKAIAEVEGLKKKVEQHKQQKGHEEEFGQLNEKLDAQKTALATAVEAFAGQAPYAEAVKAFLSQLLVAQKEANSATAAEALFDAYARAYDNLPDNQQSALAPAVVKAWNNYVKYASAIDKDSKYMNLSAEVKKLIDKSNTKYEMMSTGEKGWILADEAKNGCLEKVAEFKVEKKDGKFVAKVYGADGKEIVLKQQLTVYRPIGKDVKVLKAKVDGKDVTFAISTRGEQSYVSVPVVY